MINKAIEFVNGRCELLANVGPWIIRPVELVFGEETAIQSRNRFTRAVESALTIYPQENIAIVTHGTVLSLFASQFTGQEPLTLWQGLGMPAFAAFSHPEMKLLAQVNEIV